MRVRDLVLAFVIAAVTTSTPGIAVAKRAGFNAYASVPGATNAASADRATALRECNAATATMREHTWGVQIADVYRSCMARHGQPE